MTTFMVRSKTGRCANGMQLDAGIRGHAVPQRETSGIVHFEGKAICGTEPGRRSRWSESQWINTVTCPACLKRLETLKASEEEVVFQERLT